MKYFCILLIAYFILITNPVQSQWNYQKTSTTLDLFGVSFPNDFIGWAVGDSGLVMKTTNSGLKWYSQRISSGKFNNVVFVDENIGWVASDNGEIFKTSDGGVSWETQNTGTDNDLFALWFYDASTGWAAGDSGTFLKTTNGGCNWIIGESVNAKRFLTFHFINMNTGWLTFSGLPGGIAKTTDGGESWSVIYNFNHAQRGIYFFDELTGYTGGGNYSLYKTTDGGYNWTLLVLREVNESPSAYYTAISFIDENTGWYTESHPLGAGVYPVFEGYGESFRTRYFDMYDICVRKSGYAWAVGEAGTILFRSNSASIGILSRDAVTTDIFYLSQNFPNPFNSETKINFSVPAGKSSPDFPVRISVFDVGGREVDILANGYYKPGVYKLTYNAGKLSSGIYFCKLVSRNFVCTTKMILMK